MLQEKENISIISHNDTGVIRAMVQADIAMSYSAPQGKCLTSMSSSFLLHRGSQQIITLINNVLFLPSPSRILADHYTYQQCPPPSFSIEDPSRSLHLSTMSASFLLHRGSQQIITLINNVRFLPSPSRILADHYTYQQCPLPSFSIEDPSRSLHLSTMSSSFLLPGSQQIITLINNVLFLPSPSRIPADHYTYQQCPLPSFSIEDPSRSLHLSTMSSSFLLHRGSQQIITLINNVRFLPSPSRIPADHYTYQQCPLPSFSIEDPSRSLHLSTMSSSFLLHRGS